MLRRRGVEVDTATRVEEARQKLRVQRYFLVMLDRRLPDGDGADLLPQIRELVPRPVVIVATGAPDDALDSDGVSHVIRKPYDVQALTELITNYSPADVLAAS